MRVDKAKWETLVPRIVFLALCLHFSVFVYAQKRKGVDSLLLRKVLNIEFCFDGIEKNKSFQTLSVSLCDAGAVEVDTVNANAVADLLLCSEIRGYIEQPNYYFENPTPKTDAELDLLMLTQGWRRYDMDSIVNRRYPAIQYDIEESQSISGRVERTLNKNPKNMKLMLLSPMTGGMNSFNLGDNNRFKITNLDFVDGTPFTVQATTKNGKTSFVQIKIDEDVFPDIHTESRLTFSNNAPAVVEFYNKSRWYDEIKERMRELRLDEVTVVGHNKTWYNPFGVIPTKMLKEGDYLLDHAGYSGTVIQRLGLVLRGAESAEGELKDEHFGKYHPNKRGKIVLVPTTVYIDGFKATQEEFLGMPPENISRIEFYGRGSGLNIESDPFGKEEFLFVTTKQMARTNNRILSMTSIKPLGYKQNCDFYQPEYKPQVIPDYRTTYYWNPRLQASPDNKWSFSCLVPSMTKKVLLTIEGVGESGRIVSETKIITM